jgi:hypothetical protein
MKRRQFCSGGEEECEEECGEEECEEEYGEEECGEEECEEKYGEEECGERRVYVVAGEAISQTDGWWRMFCALTRGARPGRVNRGQMDEELRERPEIYRERERDRERKMEIARDRER